MTRAANTKNRYQIMIRTYLGRRQKLRQKYNWKKGVANPEYQKAVQTISKKLSIWRRAIKRIECRQQEVEHIALLLEDFIGVKMWGCIKDQTKPAIMARNLFYRYCLEQQIPGPDIMRYLGSVQKYHASHRRIEFIRSFAKHPENREMWQRFSRFMKENATTTKILSVPSSILERSTTNTHIVNQHYA